MGRAPCCDKNKVKRGPWSPEEDTTLRNYVFKHGTGGNWIALPRKAGLRRCGKSCRLRWLNYLRPDIKHGGFTEEEDNLIISLYSNIGSRWSVIASQLPGRTDNDIKNYWNTKLKKRVLAAAAGATGSIYSQNPPDFPCIINNQDISIATSSEAPAQAQAPPLPVLGCFQAAVLHGNSSFVTHPINHGIPEFVPEISYESTHYQDISLPSLTEVQENGLSNYSGSTASFSQEISCFSPNSYALFDPTSSANYASWVDDNGVAEEVGFLMELGSKSSCHLVDGFDGPSRETGI